jgi:hypothetical protein
MKTLITLALLVCASGFAEDGSYGLQRGSVGAFLGGGAWINGGTHPAVVGGMDFGLAKYVGLYVGAADGLAYNGRVNAFTAGGGLMVAGNNKSRIVPIGRFGLAYDRTTVFGYGGVNIPVAHYAGGFDAYVSKHFGIETEVIGGRSFGRYGGGNSAQIVFGAFYRSR